MAERARSSETRRSGPPPRAPRGGDLPEAVPGRTLAEWEGWCSASGFPLYRARQILRWIHEGLIPTFGEMTDLPLPLRERLAAGGEILRSEIVGRERAADGTTKLLLRLEDGEAVECVTIPEGARRTACISTQVGCAVGCLFCASGLDGVKRNLTASEIVEQVIHTKRELGPKRKLTNLVYMGMGEPLHNVTNLLRSIEILRAPWGANFGARRITVSTSGPPGRIPALTEAGIPVHLAVSLHAPDDDLRRRMIPGRTSTVAELIAHSKEYFDKTGRRVTFEVTLVEGLNSDPALAGALAGKLRSLPCLVNLIRMNPIPGTRLRPPPPAAVAAYRRELERGGIEVAVRKRKGDRIAAACGQLRMRSASGSEPTQRERIDPSGTTDPATPERRKRKA